MGDASVWKKLSDDFSTWYCSFLLFLQDASVLQFAIMDGVSNSIPGINMHSKQPSVSVYCRAIFSKTVIKQRRISVGDFVEVVETLNKPFRNTV